MLLRFVGLPLLLVAGLAAAPAFDVPTLDGVEPFRLIVGSGTQAITVRGTGFENEGHPNRDEYMHWQVRRAGGAWERCGRLVTNTTATCRTTGWSHNSERIEIGGTYTSQAGYVELRVFQGLANEGETNPANAAQGATQWSNVLRVPVVASGPAPVISSISPSQLPLSGDASAYRLTVNASGLDPSAVVVFRGDVVVAPEGMTAGAVQVTVPEQYRLKSAGELPLTVRTDRGGNSAPKYIRFVAMRAQVLEGIPVSKEPPMVRGMGAIARRSDACTAGYVWREATAQDHACVTPEARARAARQNAESASHRAGNATACNPGYVWREAVAGDVVCVTPAERTQAAEETRLSASHVAP